jgi:hypothetical protein
MLENDGSADSVSAENTARGLDGQMAQGTKLLTAIEVAARLMKPGRYLDADGLYVEGRPDSLMIVLFCSCHRSDI